MTRIVGNIQLGTQLDVSATHRSAIALDPVVLSIQLLPIIDGVGAAANLMSPFNTSDIESSRIMWWRSYHPWNTTAGSTVQVSGVPMAQTHDYTNSLIDIRVKRRFDRSRYALVLQFTALTVQETRWGIAFNLRGLVASTAGI